MKQTVHWKNDKAKKEHLVALKSNIKKKATSYSIDQSYHVGDYINHFKFGFGFIQKIICHTKMEVFFEDSEKVLLQNWQRN